MEIPEIEMPLLASVPSLGTMLDNHQNSHAETTLHYMSMRTNSFHENGRPFRLQHNHRDEMVTAILDDLAAHGLSVFSDIDRRLNRLMGEHLTRRTLKELVKAGQVTVEIQAHVSEIRHGDEVRQLRYKARVFALAKPKGRKK